MGGNSLESVLRLICLVLFVLLFEEDGYSFEQKVVYENLPTFCYGCGHVGHAIRVCPKKSFSPQSDLPVPAPSPSSVKDVVNF